MEEHFFEAVLQSESQIHIALRDLAMRAARLAESLLHKVREMARQFHRSVRQDLHSLIAAQRLEVAQVKLETAILWRHNFADLVAVSIFTVGSEAHDLAFIAVFAVSDEFANHGIDAAQRVRQEDAVENFNLAAFATGHHRGNEIAGPVVAESRGLLPWRAVVGAGDVGDVVFEMVLLKTQLRG